MSETRGLGKGIRALIPEKEVILLEQSENLPRNKEEITKIPIRLIQPSRFQPRQALDESKTQELAKSIIESGLIYPLLVRKIQKSGFNEPIYELIAGERRFRALVLLGETEAPVIIKEISDKKACELSLIENLQREELNPIEQALAYQRLAEQFSLTQEEISQSVGKDRATIANTLRLLKLSPTVRQEVALGRLTLGHARALLSLESEKNQWILAQRVIAEGLSVRQVEKLVKRSSRSLSSPMSGSRDPHLLDLEGKLQRALGTKVEITHRKGRGWVRVAYYSLKDLNRITTRLMGPGTS